MLAVSDHARKSLRRSVEKVAPLKEMIVRRRRRSRVSHSHVIRNGPTFTECLNIVVLFYRVVQPCQLQNFDEPKKRKQGSDLRDL